MGQADTSTKFTLVQALRGIAALWVVLFHAAAGGHLESIRGAAPKWFFASVFDAGHYGVSIFFALSGFVIAHSLRNAAITPGYAGQFALRRSIRLDPPYWVAIALVIAQQMIEARIKGTAAPDVSGPQIAAHLFYVQEILGYPHINSVFWTLCFEIQFYLGFILLLMIGRAAGPRYAGLAPVVMFALALAGAAGLYHGLPAGFALTLWHGFFVGVLAYWAGQKRRWATVAVLTLASLMIVRGSPTTLGSPISAVTALLLFTAARTGQLTKMLSARWLQWLGLVSYSLYLSHNMVTGSAYWMLRKVMPAGLHYELVQLVIVTGTCLAASYALWWLIERPSHALAKRIGRRT